MLLYLLWLLYIKSNIIHDFHEHEINMIWSLVKYLYIFIHITVININLLSQFIFFFFCVTNIQNKKIQRYVSFQTTCISCLFFCEVICQLFTKLCLPLASIVYHGILSWSSCNISSLETKLSRDVLVISL